VRQGATHGQAAEARPGAQGAHQAAKGRAQVPEQALREGGESLPACWHQLAYRGGLQGPPLHHLLQRGHQPQSQEERFPQTDLRVNLGALERPQGRIDLLGSTALRRGSLRQPWRAALREVALQGLQALALLPPPVPPGHLRPRQDPPRFRHLRGDSRHEREESTRPLSPRAAFFLNLRKRLSSGKSFC